MFGDDGPAILNFGLVAVRVFKPVGFSTPVLEIQTLEAIQNWEALDERYLIA